MDTSAFAVIALFIVAFGLVSGRVQKTIVTVLLSVFAHGLTALPGANWYAARTEKMKEEPDMPELASVTEMPVRHTYGR